MKTLMRNGRDRRSENPSLGHAKQERVSLFGTDQRITSGPAARRPHSKAEYMTAPERFADSQIPLASRAPSIHDPQIGAAGTRDAHGLGALEPRAGMYHRLLEAGGRHQRFELVRAVDHHEHARTGVARLLQPAREQRNVQADQHVGRLDRLERALAASDGL